MSLKKITLLFALLLCIGSLAPDAWAQSSAGSIIGEVYDASGAGLGGASVVVTNEATGVETPIKTNGVGIFEAPSLSAGTYSITVTQSGFRKLELKGIKLDPGQRVSENLTLDVGQVEQTVAVTASGTQINTASGEVSGTIESSEINRIDVNGHNYQSMLALVPGLNNTSAGAQLSGLGLFNSFVIASNGLGTNKNLNMIDGSYNMNSGNNGSASVNPELNTISEIRVLTDNYSAQYGYAGGAQFLIELKSGQRDFHAEAQEYVRNDDFDARNYFATSVSPLKQNIFGYTVGGPLFVPHLYNQHRDKTFFFWGQNWRKVSQGLTLLGATPTAAMRAGDFQGLGSNIIDPDTGQPFPGNTIPADRISPLATGIVNYLLPLPNNPGGGFLNYLNNTPDEVRQRQEVIRVDHSFSDRFRVLIHYIQEDVYDTRQSNQFNGSPFTNIGQELNTFGKNLYIAFTNVLNPTTVNQFGFSYTQAIVSAYPTGHAYLPSGLTIPGYFPTANPTNIVPNLNFGGGYSLAGVGFLDSIKFAPNLNYTFTDTFSKIFNAHAFSGGLFYNIGAPAQDVYSTIEGSYTFSGVYTGNAIADLLLGGASAFSQGSSMRRGQLRYFQVEPFLQDDWKVSKRLTLNLGVRYSYIPPWYLQQPVTTFQPSFFDPSQVPQVTLAGVLIPTANYNPLNGLVYAGEREQGVTQGFSRLYQNLWQPRIGFAWDVFGDGKTSLRGGFGSTYWRTQDQIWNTLTNPPFTQTVNLTAVELGNPTGGAASPAAPPAITEIPIDAKPMRVDSYSIGVERQLTANAVVRVAYAGNRSANAPWTHDLNQEEPLANYNFDPRLNTNSISVNAVRPYLGYASIAGIFTDGSGNYNSLQANFVRRYANGLSLQVAYTYAKSLGKGNDYGGQSQDTYNLLREYGPSSTDRTHMLNIGYVYDLPFFHSQENLTGKILGGWGVSGLASVDSGFPLTPSLATGTAGLATRPDATGQSSFSGKGAKEWFDVDGYAAPAPGFYGNASVGAIRGPGLFDWDLSLIKRSPIFRDKVNSEFHASFYNLLNHTNFSGVSTAYGSGSFGQITSTLDPRILEFGLKAFF